MKEPGYGVPSVRYRGTHSTHPSFKPDRSFMGASPDFRIVKEFPEAIVYRYDPQP
jgi:hypothetical protein